VWSALALMLLKIHHPKTKTFRPASFLAIKKDHLLVGDEPWKQKDLNFLLRPEEWLFGASTKRPSAKRPSLQNVLPTKRPSTKHPSTKRPPFQNVLLYKTSSYTKRPPLQNVLPQNIHRYKTSMYTKRPHCTQPNFVKILFQAIFKIYWQEGGEPHQVLAWENYTQLCPFSGPKWHQ
jgi:hypothetical protein